MKIKLILQTDGILFFDIEKVVLDFYLEWESQPIVFFSRQKNGD